MSVANIFNLGADIGAMGAATQLVLPGKISLFMVIFGVRSLAGVLLVPYSTYYEYRQRRNVCCCQQTLRKGVHQCLCAKARSLVFLSDRHSSKKSHTPMPVFASIFRDLFGELVEFKRSAGQRAVRQNLFGVILGCYDENTVSDIS
jgi:hypothetical protein